MLRRRGLRLQSGQLQVQPRLCLLFLMPATQLCKVCRIRLL